MRIGKLRIEINKQPTIKGGRAWIFSDIKDSKADIYECIFVLWRLKIWWRQDD